MKRIMTLLAVACGCLIGCNYEFPLTEEHTIPIDDAILGSWEQKLNEGTDAEEIERIRIVKRSNTEYTIDYSVEKDKMRFRGYPIDLGGISCVQLQLLEAKGDLEKDGKRLYLVASYQLTNGDLEIKLLNTSLVDDDLKTAEELRQAFLKHKDDNDLFVDPALFRRTGK